MLCLISPTSILYLRKKLLGWGRTHFENFPWRTCSSPVYGLIAEILLQRTNAEQVVPVYNQIRNMFPDYSSLSGATPEIVESLIKPLGLAKRTETILEVIHLFQETNKPQEISLDQLLSISGIGQYTAAAFYSLHKGICLPIVDKNVARLYYKFFGLEPKSEIRSDSRLTQISKIITPKRQFREFNYALIDFSRSICNNKPKHSICPVFRKCTYYNQVINE